jgi:hypothetical protein
LIALIIYIHPTRQNGKLLAACATTRCQRHRAENAKPHARRSSPGALQAADMIRKTSLLRKIEPTTRRSSFVGKDVCHGSDASKAFVKTILEIT